MCLPVSGMMSWAWWNRTGFKLSQQFIVPLPKSFDDKLPASRPGHLNMNTQVFRRQAAQNPIRPFHQAHALALKIFIHSQVEEFSLPVQAVGIEMVDRQSGAVFLDENKCG